MDVLLIEDDEDVRSNLRAALTDAGYSSADSADAAGGFACLERAGAPRVVVADINLPGGMDGIAFARAAQARFPDLGVVYISGGASRIADLAPNEQFLAKPFRIGALLTAVRDAFGRQAGNTR